MVEESDSPFGAAEWDGVLGLGQALSDNEEFNIFGVLARGAGQGHGNLTHPVFAIYLGRRIEDEAEITFGEWREDRMASPLTWVNVSQEGYWQFEFSDFTLDGKPMGLCHKYGDRKCQGVLDSGSSLMMGPQDDLNPLLAQLTFGQDSQVNCTSNHAFPKLGFVIGGEVFEMEPDEYMDRSHGPGQSQGQDICWAHLMPVGDTGRGPIFVLGMPFMRAFYTVYDIQAKRIGIAKAQYNQPVAKKNADPAAVPLVSLRPAGEDLGGTGQRLSNKASPARGAGAVGAGSKRVSR